MTISPNVWREVWAFCQPCARFLDAHPVLNALGFVGVNGIAVVWINRDRLGRVLRDVWTKRRKGQRRNSRRRR